MSYAYPLAEAGHVWGEEGGRGRHVWGFFGDFYQTIERKEASVGIMGVPLRASLESLRTVVSRGLWGVTGGSGGV